MTLEQQLKQLHTKLLDLQSKLYAKKPTVLYEAAMQSIGKDITPDDLVPDIVACAITVSTIIKQVVPDFPLVAGTHTLFDVLAHHPRFREVFLPEPGVIIISPTGMARRKTFIKNGHVGIFGLDHTIMSNDSKTGLFTKNYTLAKWMDYYERRGGYPTFLFALV